MSAGNGKKLYDMSVRELLTEVINSKAGMVALKWTAAPTEEKKAEFIEDLIEAGHECSCPHEGGPKPTEVCLDETTFVAPGIENVMQLPPGADEGEYDALALPLKGMAPVFVLVVSGGMAIDASQSLQVPMIFEMLKYGVNPEDTGQAAFVAQMDKEKIETIDSFLSNLGLSTEDGEES